MNSCQRRTAMDSRSAVRPSTAARPSPIAEKSRWMPQHSTAYSSRSSLARVGRVAIAMSLDFHHQHNGCRAHDLALEPASPLLFANRSFGWPRLKGAFATLIIANADRVVDPGEKNFTVADFPGARRRHDRLHCLFHHVVYQDHLQLDLGDEVNGIFAAAVELRMAFLPAMSASFEHGHALDTDFMKRGFHCFQLRSLDHRFDLCHRFSSRFSDLSPTMTLERLR